MDVTVLVFNGVSSADVLAPLAAIEDRVESAVRWVARQPGSVYGFEPLHRFDAGDGVDRATATDVLIVPGGLGSVRMMEDPEVTGWLTESAPIARFVLSVSTGSLLLAAAGLLDDRDASGHWLAAELLEEAGAHPSDRLVTWTGNVVTTSGPVAAAEVAATLPERVVFAP